jgi:16S rRNA (guanine527-N7)-methyltransferase
MSEENNPLAEKLARGIDRLGIAVSAQQQEKLLAYICEFDKWNKAYNLSAVRNIEQMVTRHLLDSLSVVSHIATLIATLPAQRFIDVGTGGGLPGIPLAIVFPERRFTLLDSNGKKTRFLFHVKTLLGLDNVTVENRRVEHFQPVQKFDVVISRAFASLADMTDGCRHLLAEGGVFLAMKGLYPEQELAPLTETHRLLASHPLRVPESDGERHLLILQPR